MLLAITLAAMLQTTQLEIGGKTLTVEIAETPKTREMGLMGRTSLANGEGMLFIFDSPEVLSFWMKDTLIPLSIGFFDEKKRLINTAEMLPHPRGAGAPPSYRSSSPAQYALEAPKNWFRENKITPGMKFTLQRSSKIDRIVGVGEKS
jgi:hypothetical protein